jgi:hypothetical protein
MSLRAVVLLVITGNFLCASLIPLVAMSGA